MLAPHLSEVELACYRRRLGSASFVVEYGSGGSTILALETGVSRIVSVETDPEWLRQLRQEGPIARAEAAGRLHFRLVDIGPVVAWGRPADETRRDQWPRYPRAPWPWFRWGRKPDLVFVDGRFRIASAAYSASRVGRDAIIAIHDFWNRPEYKPLLGILDCVERVETLAIFRPRSPLPKTAVAQLVDEFAYSPN